MELESASQMSIVHRVVVRRGWLLFHLGIEAAPHASDPGSRHFSCCGLEPSSQAACVGKEQARSKSQILDSNVEADQVRYDSPNALEYEFLRQR